MADFLYILTLVAFFALMVAFVRVCERVVGKDEIVTDGTGSAEAHESGTTVPEEALA